MKKNRYNLLLSITILLGCNGLAPSWSYAQSFQQGIQYYQQKEYQKAVSVFDALKNPQGYLFTGKSFYALGQYEEAQSNLNNISPDALPQIYEESVYTSALINFQQKQFAQALSKLYKVSNSTVNEDLQRDTDKLYQQILNYLSASQRQNVMVNAANDEVRFDLLKTGIDKINFSSAQTLYDTYRDQIKDDQWKNRGEQFKKFLRNASTFNDKYGTAAAKLQAPDGVVYTIGVALPEYQQNNQEFGIVKGMYFGALLAVEQFNNKHKSVKAKVQFLDTGASDENMRPVMEQFKNKKYGDVILGPLFSDQAKPAVSIATDLKMPTIAPMANSDMDVENSFLFQVNPTFKIHGKQMADFAINELGLNNFAILADKNSNGAISAEAFRDEAKKLGVDIQQYFVENLQSNNYEISKYSKYFDSDSEPVNAVYAPFTGDRALTSIDLLLKDLRTMNRSVTVLGSQEYRNLNFNSSKYHGLNMFFSESRHPDERGGSLLHFKNSYQKEYGTTGNLFSMIGYDVTRFILETLQQVGNPDLLLKALRNHPPYHGLVDNINFEGGNVNKALRIVEISPSGKITVRR